MKERKKGVGKGGRKQSWGGRWRDVGILEFRAASETNLAQIGLSTEAHWL